MKTTALIIALCLTTTVAVFAYKGLVPQQDPLSRFAEPPSGFSRSELKWNEPASSSDRTGAEIKFRFTETETNQRVSGVILLKDFSRWREKSKEFRRELFYNGVPKMTVGLPSGDAHPGNCEFITERVLLKNGDQEERTVVVITDELGAIKVGFTTQGTGGANRAEEIAKYLYSELRRNFAIEHFEGGRRIVDRS
jgi:hypothetical protein